MRDPNLFTWQWRLYPEGHRDRPESCAQKVRTAKAPKRQGDAAKGHAWSLADEGFRKSEPSEILIV